jgi:hypothetical protein
MTLYGGPLHPKHDQILSLVRSQIPDGYEVRPLAPLPRPCDQSVEVSWWDDDLERQDFVVAWAKPHCWTPRRVGVSLGSWFLSQNDRNIRYNDERVSRGPFLAVEEPVAGVFLEEHIALLIRKAAETGKVIESSFILRPIHVEPGWTEGEVKAFMEAHRVMESARLEGRLDRLIDEMVVALLIDDILGTKARPSTVVI